MSGFAEHAPCALQNDDSYSCRKQYIPKEFVEDMGSVPVCASDADALCLSCPLAYDWIGMSYLDPPADGFGPNTCMHRFHVRWVICVLTYFAIIRDLISCQEVEDAVRVSVSAVV